MERYRVEKCTGDGKWLDYGTMCIEDVKLIIRGYKRDTLGAELFGDDGISGMYTRKGTMNFYTVELA